ncbi:MAG: hypothetical protein EOP45_12060 [Sphingobacteriaceae bacterium]|nr:MAG: hypothetical protein EOP45_12060 [Sphingobacteriaceae bacterium]
MKTALNKEKLAKAAIDIYEKSTQRQPSSSYADNRSVASRQQGIQSACNIASAKITAQLKLKLDGTTVNTLSHIHKKDLLTAAGANMNARQEAWDHVEELIATGDNAFTTQELADELTKKGFFTMANPSKKRKESESCVHTANPMPKKMSTFSTATQVALHVPKNSGQHRRHVIGRHTLGQAVYKSKDTISELKKFITDYSDFDSSGSLADCQARCYKILQDHQGNLWVGDGGENSAIGFFTGSVYNWMNSLVKNAASKNMNYINVDEAISELFTINSFDFAKEHNSCLVENVYQFLAANSFIDAASGVEGIDVATLQEYVNSVAVNCEFDPNYETDHYTLAKGLFDSFCVSNYIFSDGTANKFMHSAFA